MDWVIAYKSFLTLFAASFRAFLLRSAFICSAGLSLRSSFSSFLGSFSLHTSDKFSGLVLEFK